MVIPLNVYFKIPATELQELGALNGYLGIDNKVFVDPTLLRNTEIPEFENSSRDLSAYFSPIIKLLKVTKGVGDIAWKTAVHKLQFKEEQGAALGYSAARGVGQRYWSPISQRACPAWETNRRPWY
jgi:hypothetical protein